MAEREAGIKVTLKNAGFIAGLRGLEIEGKKSGARIGYRMGAGIRSGVSAGVSSAKASMASMAKTAQGHIKTAAALGGAFAVGKFVKDAMSIQTVYRDIAHQLEKSEKRSVGWKDVMKMIRPIADESGQSISDMAGAFRIIATATGSAKYAQEQLAVIGQIATASGKDVALLAGVAEKVNRKFGLSGKAASDAIAQVASQTDIGGPKLESLGNTFDIMASEAVIAGMKGAEGLGQLMGIMNKLDYIIGVEGPGALKEMFKAFDANAPQMRNLSKIKVGFKVDESMDFTARLRKVMEDPKLFKALVPTITGPAKRAFLGMVEPYRKALKEAEAKGATPKAATAAALEAYDKFVNELNQSGKTVKQYSEDAAARAKDDPTVIMRKALNRMATAFQDPKMLDAITKLAKILPTVADKFVWFMDKLVNHPFLTAGAVVGGRAGVSFASGALSSAGKQIGSMAAKSIATKAAAMGAWKVAGAGLGVAAGAAIALYLGKIAIDDLFKQRGAEQKATAERGIESFEVGRKGTMAEKRAALARMKKEHEKLKAEKPGFFEQSFAAGAHIWTGGETPIDQHADTVARSDKAIRELEASIKKQEDAQRNATQSTSRMGTAANNAAADLEKLTPAIQKLVRATGGNPSGGPPNVPPPKPGHPVPGAGG
jgi:hypothetical protein